MPAPPKLEAFADTALPYSTKETKNNNSTSPTKSELSELPYDTDCKSELPAVIPPEHPNRTLVLCFDGTTDEFDGDNSNVVQFASLLKKGDATKQLVYYQVCSIQLLIYLLFLLICN